MVGPGELYEALVAGGARADRVTHARVLPAREGRTAPWPAWADPALVAGYRALGVEAPWEHQVVAAEAVHEGRHTVLATSTGSGKSLAFWLPALTAARAAREPAAREPAGHGRAGHGRAGRGATVLYLAPTKALAADQMAGLHRLVSAAGVRDLHLATCDGDTGTDERRWVREHADVVATNPDFLHFSLLPGHARWGRLLSRLAFVVVDECHAFRGVFGAHVALVLRRLRRVAAHHGASPVLVCASATTSQPQTSTARLIGVPASEVVAVTDDTSPAGARTVVLWQPPEPPDSRPRRTATAETADLLADLVAAGGRALAFTRSRRGAETVASAARAHLDQVAPELPDRVRAYRGGYLPEERRALEAAVRDGSVRALATTNALELGVDISGLDAVLVAGFPGTRVSWWQQAGRAGRAGADGLVVLVAREDPIDAYLLHHPEALLDAPVEPVVLDPDNPAVLAAHLAASAAEVPLRADDLDLFGPAAGEVLTELTDRGFLRRRGSGVAGRESLVGCGAGRDASQGGGGGRTRGASDDDNAARRPPGAADDQGFPVRDTSTWYWTHAQPASSLTDLRGSGGAPVQVVEQGTGRVLGTVDAASADATVHPGAVYVHQGRTFVVDDLAADEPLALVTAQDVDHGTWARWLTSTTVVRVDAQATWGPLTWSHGLVDVTTQVVSFLRRRLPDLAVLGSEELDLPPRTVRTTAVWWTVPATLLAEAGISTEAAPGALHAAEHAAIGLLPLLATCDRGDLGGLCSSLRSSTPSIGSEERASSLVSRLNRVSTLTHPDTGEATVFVHEAFPAGFTRRGYDLGPAWLRATRDTIASCPCPTGCPACVHSPKCGNANDPLDKASALRLIDAILTHTPGPEGP
ncbi:MAG: DEAD/DEAH box helicase [Micrococcales bacterium]|nr:DEAD/DEAH box helicase [Micrococcales bacterium]